jgi:hypothetical protein
MRRRLALVLLLLGPAAAAAQQPGPDRGQRCRLVLLGAEREGVSIEVAPGLTNYHVGGNVRFRCQGLEVYMRSDSVASYQGSLVQFIGNVWYRDSTVELTARHGTYLRDLEKWEARENVVYRNREDGTTLRGPALDYFRAVEGLRAEAETFADRRPTITVAVRDTATGTEEEPYVIVGDRVRTIGNERTWAAGRVTIDRSDFRGRSDSLFLDQGPAGEGALIGRALMRREAEDSFRLTGARIDLALEERKLTYVTARDSARLVTEDLTLDGDVIGLDVEGEEVEQTLAWGGTVRPVALSEDFEVRGDSLAFDTPGGALREVRAFGEAWVGARPDSASGEQDWIAGDTVVASFVERDSAGTTRTAIERIEATGAARALYRLQQQGQEGVSLSYSRADRIVIRMRVTADSVAVDSVIATGNVDGLHLQPVPARPAADTTRAGAGTALRPRPPGGRQ